jgi:protein phosphatase
MIRADEIREVLASVRDPLEACKVLTERANLAGGHDNITVIVAHFEGDGLPPPMPDDEPLKYRKYALPELSPDATSRAQPVNPVEIQTAAPSEEARRESRRLRVGHTMVGLTSPVAGMDLPLPQPAAAPPIAHEKPAAAPVAYGHDDDPVHIPTTGPRPELIGMMVIGAMVVVAVTGYFVLR